MSIFKYILSPFVEFKETDQSSDAKQTANTANTPPNNPALSDNVASQPASNPVINDSPANDYKAYFENLIEEANQKNPVFAGTDLKEYLDTKVELDTIPDEVTKIKTAFNVLKRTGLTKDKLMSTGREYIKLIESDLAGIEGAFAQQYKNEVELKEQQVQAKANEIKLLNEKIANMTEEMSQLTTQVSQSKEQLTNNKNQFILAGEQKKSEIQTELQKINQYL
jgi:hypothetical protein